MNKNTLIKLSHNLIVVAFLCGGITLIISRFCHFGRVEYTDNALVCQHITPIHSRVPGFVQEIRFEDYQSVRQGDTLVLIDDSEMRLHLAQAEADLANAQAGNRASNATIRTTRNKLLVSDARLDEARVQLENAERDYQRYTSLLANKAVTQQQFDQVETHYLAAKARYEQLSRARQTTTLVESEQTERLGQTEAVLELMEANVRLARLNLGYCAVIATADGIVGKKEIHVGQLVQAGQLIVSIVDSDNKWVEANFRESQLHHISVGSEVDIQVDAVPDRKYHGVVESMAAATGIATNHIPVDNATGNFVKVEQRLPVRIRLTDSDLDDLKAGYNVECEVKY